MGCLVPIVALFLPRLTLFFIWSLTDWTKRAFDGWFWPLLGFFIFPYTTVAYLWASLVTDKHVHGGWVFLIMIGLIADLFSLLGLKAKSQ